MFKIQHNSLVRDYAMYNDKHIMIGSRIECRELGLDLTPKLYRVRKTWPRIEH